MATVALHTVEDFPISRIVEGNLFRRLNKKKVEELKESIKTQGLLQPIRIRPTDDGRFRVTFGHHRLAACKQLGWESIPAYVIPEDDVSASNKQIIENLQRNEEKNYTLLGDWFRKLIREDGWDLVRCAREIGKTTTFIEYCMKLAEAIDPKLHADFSETIPRTLTYEFSRIPIQKQPQVMARIKKRLKERSLSTAEIKHIIHCNLPKEKITGQQAETCGNCGSIIQKGQGLAERRGSNLYLVHSKPEDCHFNDTLFVTYTGKQDRAEIREVLQYAKGKLEEHGAEVTTRLHYRRKPGA